MNKELDEKLVNRLQKALESEQFELPNGLTREQIREFILSKASDKQQVSNQSGERVTEKNIGGQ